MTITYIHHSSFLVETEHTYLLFDYYQGTLPPLRPEKPLYIFASHAHYDHFDPVIFTLGADGQEVRYLLSDDIPEKKIPISKKKAVIRIGAHETEKVGAVRVETLLSTDQGVAFWVECDGHTLYFAGDLNDWFWDGDAGDRALEQDYIRELERWKGRTPEAAFVPIDPRLGKDAYRGVDYFSRYLTADCIYPMHFWGKFDTIDYVKKMPFTDHCRDRIRDITYEGEAFIQ